MRWDVCPVSLFGRRHIDLCRTTAAACRRYPAASLL